MSKETTVFILGLLVLLSPFVGVPRIYKEWFLIAVGVALVLLGYRLRRLAFFRSIQDHTGEKRANAFVESDATPKERDMRGRYI